jgi:hypothetical protein
METKKGDEEEEWTYIGSRGETEIDYGMVKEEAWERVEELTIGDRVAGNKYRRNEPRRKEKRRSKGGAEEGDNKYGMNKE